MLLMLIDPVRSSSNRSKIRLIPFLVYLSPSLDVIASRNSSKSISQVSQISQNQERMMLQSQQYNIEMLKRINESL